MPVPHADNPGMSWPVPVRIAWLVTSFTLTTLAFLNFIYLVEAAPSAPSTLPSAELHNPVPVPAVLSPEDKGEVAVICTLRDVQCVGEIRASVEHRPSIAYDLERPSVQTSAPIKKGAPAWMQERIDYAWSKGKDVDFVLMLEIENAGTWAVDKLSDMVGANGYRDKGICQVNIGWHPEVVSDPQFNNWKWQVDTCWKMYKGGVRFYGWDVRHRVKHLFVMK